MWLVSLYVSLLHIQFETVAYNFFRVVNMTKTLLLTSHFVLYRAATRLLIEK